MSHPDVPDAVPTVAALLMLEGPKSANAVIALFTFGLLLYANSAFIHARMKEFGLLSLMGVSRAQLVWLIVIEGLLIGAAAVVSGLAAGLLFLKLFTLVLEDGTFAALMARTPAAEQLPMALWIGPGWQDLAMKQAVKELRSDYPDGGPVALSTKLEAYLEITSSVGSILFLGLFVSLVFFIASISQICFRLFTEIEDDRRYFQRLAQLGVSLRELKRLALGQAAVIFFVPFAVGVIHTTFAMKALSTIVSQSVLHDGWMVAAAYLALYVVAFAGISKLHWKLLRAGLNVRIAA